MINNVIIDLETIPGQTFYNQQVLDQVKPPASYKKPESIALWWEESGEYAKQQALHSVGLMPAYGQIVALSYALDENVPRVYFGEHERGILSCFWQDLKEDLSASRNPMSVRWVGHNITGFDLPYLFMRCMVHGLNDPLLPNPREMKPWDTMKVFDTLYQLAGTNTKGMGLANVCKLFGIESAMPDIDGSMVWQMWQDGEHSKVADYCEDDVRMTRELFYRIREYYL
jgi:predicted PolB exonuclease-like 3'-5' exonuclease